MTDLTLKINPSKEKQIITKFLKTTFIQQSISKAVIGLSGGIDSMTSFYLLKESIPLENIYVAYLYYDTPKFEDIKKILQKIKFPKKNIYLFSIKAPVDEITQSVEKNKKIVDKLRKGNIMARIRMIILFDLAKKYNALVCGTENKSESMLGYFTRFGDQASDIEPISHLYKTQVFQLAEYLGIPGEIIKKSPSAGLWADQTDEKEFGFTYEEADQVLYLSTEKKLKLKQIENKGFRNAKKILAFRKKNLFKHTVPYLINT